MDSWVCIAAILFCCGARRQNFRKPQFGVYTVWSPWEFKQFYDVFENSRDLMHLVFKSLHRNRNVALLWLKKKPLRQSSIKHIIRSRLNILRPSLYFSFFKKLSIEYHCSQTFFFKVPLTVLQAISFLYIVTLSKHATSAYPLYRYSTHIQYTCY